MICKAENKRNSKLPNVNQRYPPTSAAIPKRDDITPQKILIPRVVNVLVNPNRHIPRTIDNSISAKYSIYPFKLRNLL